MNNQLRELFWKQLGEISLSEFPELIQWVAQNSPKQFYRYRTVNDYSLYDLKNNHLGFSRVKHFDDPLDAFIRIDYQKFLDKMSVFESISVEPRKRLAELLHVDESLLANIQSKGQLIKAYQTDSFKAFVDKRKQSIRENMCMACFTETYDNENLWLKYADNHKGFCLEYDFLDRDSNACDGCNGLTKCAAYGKMMCAYPVYYSENPFDTTEIFVNQVIESSVAILEAIGEREAAMILKENATRDSELFLYQMSLVKDRRHMFDEEWRLIYPAKSNEDYPYVCVKPLSVTLGLCMDKMEEATVIEATKTAGMRKLYKMFIGENNRLQRKEMAF